MKADLFSANANSRDRMLYTAELWWLPSALLVREKSKQKKTNNIFFDTFNGLFVCLFVYVGVRVLVF